MRPTRAYSWLVALVLGLQGTTTLAALLFPAVDEAFPSLLQLTQMIPAHSLLHIATAALALVALGLGLTFLFAGGFGLFYTGLAIVGWATGAQLCLSLQPFDHPFHLVLGGLGLAAFALEASRPAEASAL